MKGNIKLFICVAVMLIAGVSMNTSGAEANQNARKGTPKFILKMSHVSTTDYPYHVAAEKVAAEVLEKTNGEVRIDLFPSNQLGSQAETTESLISGVVDIVISSAAVLSGYASQLAVCDIPFLFEDRKHAYAVFDDKELSAEIFSGIEDSLGPVVAVWENSMRSFINKRQALHSPADMTGLKFRSMQSKAFLAMFDSLGATATAMAAGEIYTSLQQGTIDGCDGTIASLFTERYYEVAPFVTISNHAYSISPIVLSPMLEKKIGKKNYEILVDTIRSYTDWQRDYATEYENVFLKKLEATDAKVNHLTADEHSKFSIACQPVRKAMAAACGEALIEKIANFPH